MLFWFLSLTQQQRLSKREYRWVRLNLINRKSWQGHCRKNDLFRWSHVQKRAKHTAHLTEEYLNHHLNTGSSPECPVLVVEAAEASTSLCNRYRTNIMVSHTAVRPPLQAQIRGGWCDWWDRKEEPTTCSESFLSNIEGFKFSFSLQMFPWKYYMFGAKDWSC